MPPGFGLPGECELWLPLGWMDVTLTERRSAHWHNVIARLKPGITVERAQTEMNVIQARLQQAHPGETIGSEVAVIPMLQQAVGRDLRTALLVLWGVVAAVLLIACANIANLMLARAATRGKELALRLALGAARWRLIRQLLVESLTLAWIGGALGVLVGWWTLQLFIAASPGNIPRLAEVAFDGTAFLFTFGSALVTGVLFGLAPAWQFSRPNLDAMLGHETWSASSGAGTGRMRNALVVLEVAMSLVLLIGAGLMLQSFARMTRVERGFQPEHLLTAELDFSVSGFTTWVQPTATRPQVPLRELMSRLEGLPGVKAIGAGSRLLRRENQPPHESFAIFGRPAPKLDEQPRAEFKGITPDWLRALGARVLRGRDFTEADTLERPGVVLINESLAHRFFPNEDPIGQRFKMGSSRPPLNATNQWGLTEWSEIVGVVSDVKSLHPRPQAVPEVYVPYWQWPMQNPTLLIRAAGDPASLAQAVRRETKAVIPSLPPPLIHTMNDLVSETVAQPRLQNELLSLFAAIALVLAALGLYGVVAYAATRRRREIGIRMALGARPRNVLALVMGQGLKLVIAGITLGLLAALALTRAIRSLLYEITPTDPVTFAVVILLLMFTALAACWLPAWRATNVDPMEALRNE
jgi:putative ABC transport system permease protein